MKMKQMILILLTLTQVASVNAADLSKKQVLTNLNSYFDAWRTRKIELIKPLYHPAVKVYDLPSNTTTEGRDKVSQFMEQNWILAVPNFIWVKSGKALVSRNTVTYEWVYSGNFTGSWGDKKIKNKKFKLRGISTTTFDKDGKITLQKDFYDLKTFETQLGV